MDERQKVTFLSGGSVLKKPYLASVTQMIMALPVERIMKGPSGIIRPEAIGSLSLMAEWFVKIVRWV
jgi:hypothetical protein